MAAAAVLPQLLRHKGDATNAGHVFSHGRIAEWNPDQPNAVGTPEQHAAVALLPRVLEALLRSDDGTVDPEVRADLALIAEGRGREIPLTKERMHRLFPQAKALHMANYGSFGGTPIPVTACHNAYQLCAVDGDSDRFLLRQVFGVMEDVHRVLASYMGLPTTDNIVLVDNAGAAFNVVAESVIFNPAFYRKRHPAPSAKPLRITVMSSGYPMVRNCSQFYQDRQRMLRDALPEGTPLWDYQVDVCDLTEAMVASLESDCVALVDGIVDFAAANEADVVIFDHCAFAPAFVYPVRELSAKIKAARPGCFVVVDAAHAIGAVSLEGVFADPVPFDAWFSNNHKWLMAPKSTAVLWFSDEYADWMHPAVKSNLYRGTPLSSTEADRERQLGVLKNNSNGLRFPVDAGPAARRRAEFYWQGTRDHTGEMSIVDLVWLRRELGDDRILARTHELAIQCAEAMAEVWGTAPLVRNAKVIGSMNTVKLPTDDHAEVVAVADWLSKTHSTHIPSMRLNGKAYCRIAPQIFSDVEDFRVVARRYLEALAAVRKLAAETTA